MRNIKLSFIALVALTTLGYTGGDFEVVTPYEAEDIKNIEEMVVEEVVKPVVKTPVIVETAVVEEPTKEAKDIYANGFYAGLGIVATRYKTSCSTRCANSGTDKTIGVLGRVGYDFNKYIGLEARGIRTSLKNDGGTVKHAGVFIKPMLPLGDKSNIYGLIGLAKTTTQGRLQRTDAETLALGAGIEVDLSKDSPKDGRYNREFDGQGDQERGLGLFVDYEKMVVKSGAPALDALSAGLTYDF
jgi:OOP family OmpA-OmpF porin